ncbi:MAG: sulfatase-like hydrolase/transferase, partial [Gammaproteobacteria bacterium]
PIHWPPEDLHTRRDYDQETCTSAGNGDPASRICFLAMIEALDFEIGNFLDHLDDLGELEDTLIFYVGDNGTSNGQRDPEVFQARTVKGSLYEGGVAVPFVVTGAGVTRVGEREDRLVNVTDVFATIGEIAGADFGGRIYDSISIAGYLTSEDGLDRAYNYSEYVVPEGLDLSRTPLGNSSQGWSVRNQDRLYMYDLATNSENLYQINDQDFVLVNVTEAEPGTLRELRDVALSIRGQ